MRGQRRQAEYRYYQYNEQQQREEGDMKKAYKKLGFKKPFDVPKVKGVKKGKRDIKKALYF